MLEKSKNITTIFCTSIVILVVSCIIIVTIFFTKDEITKEMIAGINPVATTKSIMIYQEPLTVILEDVEKEIPIQQEKLSQNTKEAIEIQEIDNEMQEDIKIETNVDLDEQIQDSAETNAVLEKQIQDSIEINTILEEQIQDSIETNTILEEQMQDGREETIIETVIEEVQQKEETQNSILAEYKGYNTVGKIEIPQTGVDIPILNQVTVGGMKHAPCLLYATGELNQNGNNLIVGHNFRNGTIFSNNKNLKLGDKIYVTTLDGNRVEYTIYDKFITTAEDVSYIKRDTNNKPEITLSCCTDDDEYRIIILAKV